MHYMFVHPNFPSQFGQLALYLSRLPGNEVTFVTSTLPDLPNLPFEVISYKVGDRPIPRAFAEEYSLVNNNRHAEAVYGCLRCLDDLRPDVVCGHSGYGTWLYLRPVYNARFVAYHEMIPAPPYTERFNMRPDYPPDQEARAFNMGSHAFAYLHLHHCDVAYTPTAYQMLTVPDCLRNKVAVCHDGVDTELFKPQTIRRPFQFRGIRIGKDAKVVTYLSRGLESFRGFDIFMRAVKIVMDNDPNVIALVAGGERTVYGHDLHYTGGQTFKQHVLSQDNYPLDRIHFLGLIPPSDLPTLYSLSQCHIYLTVPWVLSWSLIQALSCGAPLLVSDTLPLKEVIEPGTNGLAVDFYDHDSLAYKCHVMLDNEDCRSALGRRGRELALAKYSLTHCLPKIKRILDGE